MACLVQNCPRPAAKCLSLGRVRMRCRQAGTREASWWTSSTEFGFGTHDWQHDCARNARTLQNRGGLKAPCAAAIDNRRLWWLSLSGATRTTGQQQRYIGIDTQDRFDHLAPIFKVVWSHSRAVRFSVFEWKGSCRNLDRRSDVAVTTCDLKRSADDQYVEHGGRSTTRNSTC